MKILSVIWLLLGITLFTLFGPAKVLLAQMATEYDPQNEEAQIYDLSKRPQDYKR